MRYAEFEELDTPRLHLRKIGMGDVKAYYERLGSSEEVTKYMLFQPHRDISDSVASIEKSLRRYEAGRSYRWAVTLRESGELIGVIDLLAFDEERSSCSFAYMLGKDFWGRGYGTEALRAAIHFGFSKLELERIEADHMAENGGSGAVMRKAGMTYLGTTAGKYEKDGILHDAPRYGISREEWRKSYGSEKD